MSSKPYILAMILVCMLGLVVQAEREISTADGDGADTWLQNDQSGQDNTNGSESRLQLRKHSAPRCRIPFFRFDISSVSGLRGALLQVDSQEKDTSASVVWSIYGLNDDVEGNDWDESSTSYNNAPGFTPETEGEYEIDPTEMTLLGTITYPGDGYRGIIQSNTDDLDLDDFLLADTDGLVTFAIFDFSTDKEFRLVSKEREASDSAYFAPRLILRDLTVQSVYPEEGQEDVELDVTLEWLGIADPNDDNDIALDPNTIAHNVYIDFDNTDDDPNLTYQGQVPVTSWASREASYGPLSLSLDDSISWQIEEVKDYGSGAAGDANNIMGPVFSFTAIKSVPVVSQDQPEGLRVFPEGPAVLSVDFTSVSAPTDVKWYHYDNTTETEVTWGTISTTDNGGGSYTTELDLGTALDSSYEGQYFCSVSNNGEYYDSGLGDVVIKRQLANYAFEGTLTDSSSNGAPEGTAMDSQGDDDTSTHVAGTIDYVTGADLSSALYLDPNEYINFTVEGYPKACTATTNGFGGGLDEGTIVFWVKANGDTGSDQMILNNFNNTDKTGFIAMFTSDQENDIYIRDTSTGNHSHPKGKSDRPEYDLYDGQWHMMAACWSPSGSSIYVDGQWVADGSATAPSSFTAWDYGTLLGAARTGDRTYLASNMFGGGAIDDLRIYNYRVDDDGTDVFAQEYLSNTGIRPCTNPDFLDGMVGTNFDNTGSSYCIVDLLDFAAFAETWLVSGLY